MRFRKTQFVITTLVILFVQGTMGACTSLTSALLFFPQKGQRQTPSVLGLKFESLHITAKDGTSTEAWWIPHSHAQATVVFFHGNGGSMAGSLEFLGVLHRLEVSVLMSEYRGYGNSEGEPSERGLNMDAQAAVKRARGLSRKIPLIVLGHSLGGAVAIDVASTEHVDGLIVVSTFTSLQEIVRVVIPIPFVWLLAAFDFASIQKIRGIDCPTLIIHGDADELVPFSMGKRLFAASGSPAATFLRIKGGRHNDTWNKAGPIYKKAWQAFLRQVLKVSNASEHYAGRSQ